jgi:hypothetical protein
MAPTQAEAEAEEVVEAEEFVLLQIYSPETMEPLLQAPSRPVVARVETAAMPLREIVVVAVADLGQLADMFTQ